MDAIEAIPVKMHTNLLHVISKGYEAPWNIP